MILMGVYAVSVSDLDLRKLSIQSNYEFKNKFLGQKKYKGIIEVTCCLVLRRRWERRHSLGAPDGANHLKEH